MTTDLLRHISAALTQYNLPIYVHEIEQGFQEPCFYIYPIRCEMKRIGMYQQMWTIDIDLHYFNKNRPKALEMAEGLIEIMEWLGPDCTYAMGRNISSEYMDGVLHVFVTYHFFTREAGIASYAMQRMNSKGDLHG